jgi:hypothetical protein
MVTKMPLYGLLKISLMPIYLDFPERVAQWSLKKIMLHTHHIPPQLGRIQPTGLKVGRAKDSLDKSFFHLGQIENSRCGG